MERLGLGTPDYPLRVAVIGSGPSGFYAAEHLQEQEHLEVQIDMYDRLPTLFGLVRGGVAPDTRRSSRSPVVYDKIAAHPRVPLLRERVEMGRDITHVDLSAYYHAIIYAVGARTDWRMGIPCEYLLGSHSATEFVGWYNAHPDFRHLHRPQVGDRGGGRQRKRGDGPRPASSPAPGRPRPDRHRRARPPGARRDPHPRDPRPRPARPRPGGVHQQGAEGAGGAAGGGRDRRPAGGGPRPPQRRVGGLQPEPHPRPQPRDPAGIRRLPAGRLSGSTCTSSCRRWS